MDQETGSTAQAEPTTEAGPTSIAPVAVTPSFTPTKRPPFTGWVRRSTADGTGQVTKDSPAYFVRVENDVDTTDVVTEAELTTFYKQNGQALRGVKQKDQIDALIAVRNNPGTTLTGYDKQTKTPQLSPITTADATGDSTTTQAVLGETITESQGAFTPSER